MADKIKPGRGRPPADDPRTEIVRVRLTKAERAKLDTLAAQKSMTRAEYVRTLIERAVKRG